jgi:hypothetical protein
MPNETLDEKIRIDQIKSINLEFCEDITKVKIQYRGDNDWYEKAFVSESHVVDAFDYFGVLILKVKGYKI